MAVCKLHTDMVVLGIQEAVALLGTVVLTLWDWTILQSECRITVHQMALAEVYEMMLGGN